MRFLFSLSTTAPCPAPTTLTATNITATTANLGWTVGGSETAWEYVVQAAGGAAPSGSGTATSSNPTSVTGLTTGTAYEFYVRANCGSSNYSAWVGPFAFSTVNNALNFDGVDDYVSCGAIGQSTPLMTLEVWVKPATGYGTFNSGTEPAEIISRWGAGGAGNASYRLGINSSGKAVFQVYNGSAISGVTSAATITPNVWTHLTAVRAANNNLLIYVNGVLNNSVTNSVVPQVSSYQVNLARPVVGVNYYKGLIDEVRIWNIAFNATNVTDYYNKTFSNPTDAASYLLAYYKLDETTGSTAPDASGNGNTATFHNMANDDWVASNTGVTSSLVSGLSVLPVELLAFTATARGEMAELSWQTASEENNRGFEVERATMVKTLKPSVLWKGMELRLKFQIIASWTKNQ
ncbi:MAG: LamG domain-containing protein [Saprospiraceae bacterium]|nr:LamG domain-containing protein [Saprospiraceae bacterium]